MLPRSMSLAWALVVAPVEVGDRPVEVVLVITVRVVTPGVVTSEELARVVVVAVRQAVEDQGEATTLGVVKVDETLTMTFGSLVVGGLQVRLALLVRRALLVVAVRVEGKVAKVVQIICSLACLIGLCTPKSVPLKSRSGATRAIQT